MITIGSSGLSPGSVTITPRPVGHVRQQRLRRALEVASGPVPSYDGCLAINRVGRLEPGQRMQTGALTAAAACGFLDLLPTSDSRWQGTITVQ